MGQLVHLDNYVRVPDCEVKAICDIRPKLLDAVAAKYRVPNAYCDDKEMLGDPGIAGIVCCQPATNTQRLAKEVLIHGKHLLTQSPIATNSEDARELVEMAEEKGLVYGVGCMKRYDIGVEKARTELIRCYETEQLGALLRVDANCFGGDWQNEIRPPIDFPDEPTPEYPEPHYPDFLEDNKKAAYMEYLSIYTHNINLLRYLLPASEQLKFSNALISTNQGILSHTTCFLCGDVPVCLQGTSTKAHEWLEETTFIFEKGHIKIKTPPPLRMQASAEVEVYASDGFSGERCTFHSPRLWAFMLQAAGFAGAAAGISEFRALGKDCINDLILVEEIFKKAVFI